MNKVVNITKQAVINKISTTLRRIIIKKHLSIPRVSKRSKCSKDMIKELKSGNYTYMPKLPALIHLDNAIYASKEEPLVNILRRAIGNRIAYLRSKKKWTQEYLAYQIGVSKSHVEDLELGKYRIKKKDIIKISHLFGVNYNYITYRACDSKKQNSRIKQMSLHYHFRNDSRSDNNLKTESHKRSNNMNCLNMNLNGNKLIRFKVYNKGHLIMNCIVNINQISNVYNAINK